MAKRTKGYLVDCGWGVSQTKMPQRSPHWRDVELDPYDQKCTPQKNNIPGRGQLK